MVEVPAVVEVVVVEVEVVLAVVEVEAAAGEEEMVVMVVEVVVEEEAVVEVGVVEVVEEEEEAVVVVEEAVVEEAVVVEAGVEVMMSAIGADTTSQSRGLRGMRREPNDAVCSQSAPSSQTQMVRCPRGTAKHLKVEQEEALRVRTAKRGLGMG